MVNRIPALLHHTHVEVPGETPSSVVRTPGSRVRTLRRAHSLSGRPTPPRPAPGAGRRTRSTLPFPQFSFRDPHSHFPSLSAKNLFLFMRKESCAQWGSPPRSTFVFVRQGSPESFRLPPDWGPVAPFPLRDLLCGSCVSIRLIPLIVTGAECPSQRPYHLH